MLGRAVDLVEQRPRERAARLFYKKVSAVRVSPTNVALLSDALVSNSLLP